MSLETRKSFLSVCLECNSDNQQCGTEKQYKPLKCDDKEECVN